eukprot:2710394-Rhodomonas_salina.4
MKKDVPRLVAGEALAAQPSPRRSTCALAAAQAKLADLLPDHRLALAVLCERHVELGGEAGLVAPVCVEGLRAVGRGGER